MNNLKINNFLYSYYYSTILTVLPALAKTFNEIQMKQKKSVAQNSQSMFFAL